MRQRMHVSLQRSKQRSGQISERHQSLNQRMRANREGNQTRRDNLMFQQVRVYPQVRGEQTEPRVSDFPFVPNLLQLLVALLLCLTLLLGPFQERLYSFGPLRDGQTALVLQGIDCSLSLTRHIVEHYNRCAMELEDMVLLVMGTLIVIGYGYSLDMPQALEVPLRAPPYNLTSIEFNWLYICCNLPIVFTDIPLGLVLDRFPLQKTVIVIALASFTAELLTALLFDYQPQGFIYMVYALRAVVGMAGSSAFTMQGFVMARYGAEHFEILIGFGLCVPYIVDSINVMITPIIYQSTKSISLPWYIASFVDFFAVIAALVISYIVTRKEKRRRDQLALSLTQPEEQQEQFKVSYLLQLPRLFWLVNLTILGNEIVMNIYTNLNDLIVNRFNIAYVTAGKLLLIPYTLGSVFSLLFGRVLTLKPTLRRKMVVATCVLISVAMVMLYFLSNVDQNDEASASTVAAVVAILVLFSMFSGSIYTVLTSSVSLLCDKKRLGTAWGVVGTAIGLGQAVSPAINGLVENDDNLKQSYRDLSLVYIFLTLLPMCLSLAIYFGPHSILDNTFDAVHGQKEELPIEHKSESVMTDKQ